MIRINRYSVRGRWYWRVWRGDNLIARGVKSYSNSSTGSIEMERDLRLLFPYWVK
jgi:hypothetical protein